MPDLFQTRMAAQSHSATSIAAGESYSPKAPTDRQRVLDFLKGETYGATDDEMQDALAMNPSTQRPRRIDLVAAGLVVDSGSVRKTKSGCKAVVWLCK